MRYHFSTKLTKILKNSNILFGKDVAKHWYSCMILFICKLEYFDNKNIKP